MLNFKVIGAGAAGNKAAINAIEKQIVPKECVGDAQDCSKNAADHIEIFVDPQEQIVNSHADCGVA